LRFRHFTLSQSRQQWPCCRARAIAHKRARTLHLGAHATLLFEDRFTVQYQVQEMLRVERIFEASGIDEELGAYNPLVPDGRNLKATLLFEYPDETERRRALAALGGIEHRFFAQVDGSGRIAAHADEDLDRSTDDKTSAKTLQQRTNEKYGRHDD